MSEFNTEYVHHAAGSRLRVRGKFDKVELTITNNFAPYNSTTISLDVASAKELVGIVDGIVWDLRMQEVVDAEQ